MKKLTNSKRAIIIITYFLSNQIASNVINLLADQRVITGLNQLVYIQFFVMLFIALFYLGLLWRELMVDIAVAKYNKKFFIICLKYFGYAFLTVIVMSFILNLLGVSEQPLNQVGVESMALIHPIVIFFTVVILAPIIEEIVFRMAMIVLDSPSTFVTLFISSFVFGFVHISGAIAMGNFQEMWFILIYGGLGAVLGLSYVRTKSIMTPIVVHALYNLMGFLSILLANG